MFEVIICLVLHCVMSFVLKYCYDKEIIWHNDETKPRLHMPKLFDLVEDSSIYDKQNYVEKVIFPAKNYFSAVSDIEDSQNEDSGETMLHLIAWLPTFLLVANAFRRVEMFPYIWLDIVIGIIACILITFIVSMIYNRTKLKLGTFELSISDIKNDFYYIQNHGGFEFDLSDEDALNNFIIEKHYDYIRCVHYTISKRYSVRKIVEKITGVIYILFIWRIPD